MSGILGSLLSGLCGAIIGFIASFLTIKLGYKRLFAETVSQNRMDWINNFREELSVFIGTWKALGQIKKRSSDESCKTCLSSKCKDKGCETACKALLEAERARAKLLTRLNQDITKPGNEYNKKFADFLNNIDLQKSFTQADFDTAIDYSRKILEPEWIKVKKEARGEVK